MTPEQIKSGSLDDVKAAADALGLKEDLRVELARRQIRRLADAVEHPRQPLELLTEDQLHAISPAEFIVPGLILEASLGMIVGAPGSLKTFTALDFALSYAAGLPNWLGRPMKGQGAVVYVLGEGAGRFSYRIKVWRQERKITDPLPFFIMRRPVDLRDEKQMADFLKLILGHQPKVIIFDTLSRNIAGAEENSAKEYGEAIAACNLLQQETGATVQLLHHPTKDGSSARGSGAGRGAVDSELWMAKESLALFKLSVGKAKEADDDQEDIDLKKRTVELAGHIDQHGVPVKSCVVELATPADVAAMKDSLEYLVIECVQKNPNIKRGEVHQKIRRRKDSVGKVIDALIADGCLVQSKSGNSQLIMFVGTTQQIPF